MALSVGKEYQLVGTDRHSCNLQELQQQLTRARVN